MWCSLSLSLSLSPSLSPPLSRSLPLPPPLPLPLSPCRDFGAIPGLINQLRNRNEPVQLCVLQALRNLSFGRANNENKLQIVGDAGLQEMMLLLKNSSNPTVRELITSVLWNLSSSEVSDEGWMEGERERDGQRDRQTVRDRERQRQRQTDRQTENQLERM